MHPNYLPKAPLPNTITLGSSISIYEFGEEHEYSVHDTCSPKSVSQNHSLLHLNSKQPHTFSSDYFPQNHLIPNFLSHSTLNPSINPVGSTLKSHQESRQVLTISTATPLSNMPSSLKPDYQIISIWLIFLHQPSTPKIYPHHSHQMTIVKCKSDSSPWLGTLSSSHLNWCESQSPLNGLTSPAGYFTIFMLTFLSIWFQLCLFPSFTPF